MYLKEAIRWARHDRHLRIDTKLNTSKAGMKQGLLILNTFVCVGLFTATALSVLKVWISAGL